MTSSRIIPIASTPRLSTTAGGLHTIADTLDARGLLKYHPHEHLFFQGDTPTGVFIVQSGTVILYKLMQDGRRQIQDFASAGDFLALAFTGAHDLSAEALTDVDAVFIPQARFDSAMQSDPAFRHQVFATISTMLAASREQALLLGRKSAMERVASFLCFLFERFADQRTGYADIRMSRCDIADYLGLTLETVSRMMNRLKRLRVIDLPTATRFSIIKDAELAKLSGDIEDSRFACLG